jgi:hypothetical protein
MSKKKFDPMVDPFVSRERNILKAVNKYKKEIGKSLSWKGKIKENSDFEYVAINSGCSPQVKVKTIDKNEKEILKTQFDGCGKPIFLGKELPKNLKEVQDKVPRYFSSNKNN